MHCHHAGEIGYGAARKGQIFSVVDLILATIAYDEQLRLFSLDARFKEVSKFCPFLLEIS
jgi:predicted nucleic acid-binding protein